MTLEMLYAVTGIILGYLTAIVYPAYTKALRHEMGHALAYYRYSGDLAVIHVPERFAIPLEFRQFAYRKCIFKHDLHEYLGNELKKGKHVCAGITEMRGHISREAVPVIARAGAVSGAVGLVRHISWTCVIQYTVKYIFIKWLDADPSVPGLAPVFAALTLIWPAVEYIGYRYSGYDGGDRFFVMHPEKWENTEA